jgi:beta-ureidopropionase / N-carbamoyl-L-amino-acid hydrolase
VTAATLGPPREDRFQVDLDRLATFVDPDESGWTRRVFTRPFAESRPWLASTMADAGLEVRIDPSGNIIGTLRGGEPGALPIVTGSHTDTVAGGGRFDGILGVLGAIEAVRSLRDQGVELGRDLVVVDFLGEEPNDFGLSCVGSRAITGELSEEHLLLRDPSGRPMADAFADMGIDPGGVFDARWESPVLAFVELHIEQGPVLEAAGQPIGVVEAIAGISRFRATFEGRGDHAGTMPMGMRRDAACAAAEGVLALESIAAGDEGVATSGVLDLVPGSINIVPEHATLWGELRSTDPEWLRVRRGLFDEAVVSAGQKRRVVTDVAWLSNTNPTPCEDDLQAAIEVASARLGMSTMRLPSGAGHDAVQMAALAPVGMIFVPSKGGRSHVPEEWTDPAECAVGIHVLAQTILDLDRAGSRAVG